MTCDVSTRMDKLKIHFSKYVLWDDNDTVLSSVCESSNPRNKRASTKYQCHTDSARTKNIKSDSIPSFQIISLVKDNMTIKNFLNINNSNGEREMKLVNIRMRKWILIRVQTLKKIQIQAMQTSIVRVKTLFVFVLLLNIDAEGVI